MSQGNSGNIIPNLVSNILTPGLKRSWRLAEKRETVLTHYPVTQTRRLRTTNFFFLFS